MATAEKFCLRWNDFESNISSAFRELREDKDFFDVTLACDDDQIQAHKVILSACSPFFRTVLKRNRHEHPLLYLKGVKYIDLVAVLNFMYHGEVNVAQEELNSFLSIAEELKVKGLTQNNGSENSQSPSPKPPREQKREPPEPKTPQQKRPRPQQAPQPSFHQSMSDPMPEAELREVEEIAMVKSEPVGGGSTEQQVAEADYMESYENYEGYDEEEGSYDGALLASGGGVDGNKGEQEYESMLKSMIDRVAVEGVAAIQCRVCLRTYKPAQTTNLKNHLEAKHIDHVQFSCSLCNGVFSSRASFRTHARNFHRDQERPNFIISLQQNLQDRDYSIREETHYAIQHDSQFS